MHRHAHPASGRACSRKDCSNQGPCSSCWQPAQHFKGSNDQDATFAATERPSVSVELPRIAEQTTRLAVWMSTAKPLFVLKIKKQGDTFHVLVPTRRLIRGPERLGISRGAAMRCLMSGMTARRSRS